ncbi:24988_t:CDS:2, partial [Racocetra persica]
KGWFDRSIDDNQINNSNRVTNVNGENWELRMVITSSYLDFVSQSDLGVIAVKTLNISKLQPGYVGKNITENILLTLFENGNVATFNLDKAEQEMKLWFIIKRRWQMYLEPIRKHNNIYMFVIRIIRETPDFWEHLQLDYM